MGTLTLAPDTQHKEAHERDQAHSVHFSKALIPDEKRCRHKLTKNGGQKSGPPLEGALEDVFVGFFIAGRYRPGHRVG